MTKFFGNVGYVETVEIEPGVWRPVETIRQYYGDWIRYSTKFQVSSEGTNDNVNVSNELSIMADAYADKHFSSMRYVEFMGAKWKIISVQPGRPRIILTIGGIWNGEQAEVTE